MCGSSAGPSCCANAVEGDVDDTPDVPDPRPWLAVESSSCRWTARNVPDSVPSCILASPFFSM